MGLRNIIFHFFLFVALFKSAMIVNSLIIHRMLSTFPFKLRQFHKLSVFTKCLSSRFFYFNFTIVTQKQQINFITLANNTVRSLSDLNKTNPLPKTMTGEGDQSLNVNYDDILKAQNDDSVLIIDVREDSEIQKTGKLPGSIHIPMGEVATLLTNLSNQEFQKKFDKQKPTYDTKIILSCAAGRRSAAVQSDLLKLGYKNPLNYLGGWLDWESRQKA